MVGVSNSVKVADLISDLNDRIKYLERANEALTEYNENARNDINELNNVARDYKKKYLKEKEKHEKATRFIAKSEERYKKADTLLRTKKMSSMYVYGMNSGNGDEWLARTRNIYKRAESALRSYSIQYTYREIDTCLDGLETYIKSYFNNKIDSDELVASLLREVTSIKHVIESNPVSTRACQDIESALHTIMNSIETFNFGYESDSSMEHEIYESIDKIRHIIDKED